MNIVYDMFDKLCTINLIKFKNTGDDMLSDNKIDSHERVVKT